MKRVVVMGASLLAGVLAMFPVSGGAQVGGSGSASNIGGVSRARDGAGTPGDGMGIGPAISGGGSVITTSGLELELPILGFGSTTTGIGSGKTIVISGGWTVGTRGGSTSILSPPSSLLGPLDLGTNPPFTSFGRFLPGVGPNASGTRPSPRLRTPGAAPSAATSSGGVVWDSFCDPQDFTCGQ